VLLKENLRQLVVAARPGGGENARLDGGRNGDLALKQQQQCGSVCGFVLFLCTAVLFDGLVGGEQEAAQLGFLHDEDASTPTTTMDAFFFSLKRAAMLARARFTGKLKKMVCLF
jgi:hypothetical protein